MPAETYEDIYKFAENVSAAVKVILEADIDALIGDDGDADEDAFIFGPKENDKMPTNRIEAFASAFAQASDQQIQAASNGEWFFAHFGGQITFSVLTPRGSASATAEHGNRVGRINYLMQPRARRFTEDNLPHYEILRLSLASIPKTEPDTDLDADRTDITYNIELWTRPTAFPEEIP